MVLALILAVWAHCTSAHVLYYCLLHNVKSIVNETCDIYARYVFHICIRIVGGSITGLGGLKRPRVDAIQLNAIAFHHNNMHMACFATR